ncbi:MAG: SPOCS domain-containing protein, partial [Wujia sp.]
EVRGLIGDGVSVYEDSGVNCATDLLNGQGIECLYKDIVMTDLVIAKNDVFKIREEIEVQDSKPNISEICWSSVDLRNMEIKALDDKISVRGELEIFVIYKGNEEHLPIQYLYSVRTIFREIECQGSREGMIIETECTMGKGDVNIRQDSDGEDRIIAVDYSVNMNIKMYEDMEFRLLSDMYSPQAEIRPDTVELCYENLVMRNSAKAKVNHRHKVSSEAEKILQVCHVYGSVDVDDIAIHEENVHITGVIKSNVLYISSGDDPMSCMHIDIPFEYSVDTNPLSQDASVRIVPSLDMLSASLLNSEEIEIKAQVNLGISIFTRSVTNVITDTTVEDIDYEKKAAMPGIVGYIVKKGDTIWSIARKYYATTESIRTVNNLESDNIKEGDRLIIVKS